MPPRNFYDSGCCIPETLGTAVITGCLSFGATGSLRLPNRTTFPAGACGGAGAIRHDTTLNAIVYRFGGPVTGSILGMPPATGVPSPVPVQVSDDGVNAPTISPIGTLSATPFPDMADARLVIGLPASGTAPSLANSVFHFEPNLAAGTTTLTVKPFVGGVVSTTWIVDLPNAGTTTLQLINSTVGQVANLSADGTLEGLSGVQGGTSGAQVTLTTVGGVPTLGTSGVTNLSIAPGGGTTTVTGALTATGKIKSTNPQPATAFEGQVFTALTGGNYNTVGTAGYQIVSVTVIDGARLGQNFTGLLPDIADSRNLGSAGLRWDNLFLSSKTQSFFLAAPSGAAGVPTFRTIATADLPAGTGTVTSVALTMPGIFGVGGSPITTSGTLSVTLGTQTAGTVFAGPTTGVAAIPTFRSISAVAIGTTDFASILGGNLILGGPVAGGAGFPFFRGLVTADLPAGTGTVTSVGLTMPAIFSVAGSPITTSGTLAVTLGNQSANLVWAGPASGAAAAPTFRSLVALDIPTTLNSTTISTQLTVTTITTPAATRLTLTSLEPATGGADIGFILNASSLGTVAADKIASFRTANVERAFVGADGTVQAGANAAILSTAGLGAFVGIGTGFILLGSNAGAGGGTCFIQDTVAVTGALSTTTTITGTTLNCTTGLNTGAGAGTNRITSAGALLNITTLTLSGAISGGTTVSCSSTINTTGGTLQTNSTTRITNAGLTNNMTIDGGATGCTLKIKDVGVDAPAEREIGITEDVPGVQATISVTLNGTTYNFIGAP